METIISQESRVKSQESENRNSETENRILAENGFFWRNSGGVKVLVARRLEENGFANAFSTRLGGVSPFPAGDLNLAGFDEDTRENIFENRCRFLNVFASNYKLATAWQVHGGDVKIVRTETDAASSEERFDALVSDMENLLVGVKTADCVPVLLGDVRTRAFAAVHAGWRGTVSSIVVKAVEKMRREFGTRPEDLLAAIGPAATCKNYEIGREVVSAFEEKFPASEKLFTPTRDGHALVDLHLANKDQLLGTGVAAENIAVAPLCTMERTDLFFSYRVEKRLYGKTGRLLSAIGRK